MLVTRGSAEAPGDQIQAILLSEGAIGGAQGFWGKPWLSQTKIYFMYLYYDYDYLQGSLVWSKQP